MTAATEPSAAEGRPRRSLAVIGAFVAMVLAPGAVAAAPGATVGPEAVASAVPLDVAASVTADSTSPASPAADPSQASAPASAGTRAAGSELRVAPPPAPTPQVIAPAVAAPEVRPAVRLAPPAPAEPVVEPLLRPVVALYGDSLAWEARDAFVDALADRPGVDVVVHTFGGTAICDWLDQMATDAVTIRPGAVVVEFSGNNFTPCMQDAAGTPLTGAAFLARYAADALAVIETFAPGGTQVVFASGPITRAASERGQSTGLNALYADLAGDHEGVRYVDAGAAVLADGRWTATLPCLPDEPCTGGLDADGVAVNVVRAPDGIHFCPASAEAVAGVTGTCPVWSSGALRYGRALAAPVVAGLDAMTA
ncbi:MAG: hypothetical protein HKN44_12160 [Ilumatobacter sp.]|nr:hypothetical protein [Ilumatobacter sp.]